MVTIHLSDKQQIRVEHKVLTWLGRQIIAIRLWQRSGPGRPFRPTTKGISVNRDFATDLLKAIRKEMYSYPVGVSLEDIENPKSPASGKVR
jgi:hypothetical protein